MDNEQNDSSKEMLKDIRDICEKMMEKQNKQDESKGILEIEMGKISEKLRDSEQKQEELQMKILEKLESLQEKSDGRKRKLDSEDQNNPAKRPNVETPFMTPQPTPLFKFVVRNVFRNISKIGEEKYSKSENEEHFGVPWQLNVCRKDKNVGAYLRCAKLDNLGGWAIDAEYTLKIIHSNGKSHSIDCKFCFDTCAGYGNPKIIEMKDLVNDKVTVEAYVNIIKMTGIYKNKLRSFGESTKDCSDIVLIVKDEKFYTSKFYLAIHSPYFKAMLLGLHDELTEISLTGINPEDFQNYLEVLYGDYAINEVTVEGILLVAHMYSTDIVVRKCEEFLIKESKKELKKMLQMSVRYNLENLKEKCLSGIETIADIRSLIPGDIRELDPATTTVLLEKSLSLYQCFPFNKI